VSGYSTPGRHRLSPGQAETNFNRVRQVRDQRRTGANTLAIAGLVFQRLIGTIQALFDFIVLPPISEVAGPADALRPGRGLFILRNLGHHQRRLFVAICQGRYSDGCREVTLGQLGNGCIGPGVAGFQSLDTSQRLLQQVFDLPKFVIADRCIYR
jgi:hypothetical protein